MLQIEQCIMDKLFTVESNLLLFLLDFLMLILSSLRVEAVHSRVAELNPYVQVSVSTDVLDESTDLSFLKRYQVCLLLIHTFITCILANIKFLHGYLTNIPYMCPTVW